jgi:hypothetical protein
VQQCSNCGANLPTHCAYRDPRRARDSGDPTQEVAGVLAVPAPEGFDWQRVPLGDGVDAKSHAFRWQQSAAAIFGKTVDAVELVRVGAGVAYLQLPWELVALDARTGHLRWSGTGKRLARVGHGHDD